MGESTVISWTDHTWNPWIGCAKVSPGCAHCYAQSLVRDRMGRDFSQVRKTKTWGDPVRWNRRARFTGKHDFVFTCSLSDFFIEDADAWRTEAWALMKATHNLTYQIVTKRPENVVSRLPQDWGTGYENIWLGVSVENLRFLSRMNALRDIPAVLRFISAEPLLEDLMPELADHLHGFAWVIVGGESGNGTRNFRPMEIGWVRAIKKLCDDCGVAFWFKQSAAIRTEMGITLDGVKCQSRPSPLCKHSTGFQLNLVSI